MKPTILKPKTNIETGCCFCSCGGMPCIDETVPDESATKTDTAQKLSTIK